MVVPSGATSLTLANQFSGEASAPPWISTWQNPRISRSSASGAESNVRLYASAPRWSTVSSPHQWPASIPADGTYRSRTDSSGPGSADSVRSAPQYSTWRQVRSGGSAVSVRQ